MSDGVFVAELRRRVDQMLAADHHFLVGLLAEITKAPVPEEREKIIEEIADRLDGHGLTASASIVRGYKAGVSPQREKNNG